MDANAATAAQLLAQGTAHEQRGYYQQALECYQQALENEAADASAYGSIAKVLYIMGDYPGAAKHHLEHFRLGYLQQAKEIEALKQAQAPLADIQEREESLGCFIGTLCTHLGHALFDESNDPALGKIYLGSIDPCRKEAHHEGLTDADFAQEEAYEKFCREEALKFIHQMLA